MENTLLPTQDTVSRSEDHVIFDTSTPSDDPVVTPAASVAPEVTPDPERAVYDGDVGDTYLSKLSAYYNEHAKLNTKYVIYRPSQYIYRLVYGDTNNYTTWTNATVVEIENSANYYNNSVVEVTNGVSYTIDITGNTAFVYSSSVDLLPSRYINTNVKTTPYLTYFLLVLFVIFLLYNFIIKLCGIKR